MDAVKRSDQQLYMHVVRAGCRVCVTIQLTVQRSRRLLLRVPSGVRVRLVTGGR